MNDEAPMYCIETGLSNVAVAAMVKHVEWSEELNSDDAKNIVEALLMSATMAEDAAEDTIPSLSDYVKAALDFDRDADIFEALSEWGRMADEAGLTPYIIHNHPEEG